MKRQQKSIQRTVLTIACITLMFFGLFCISSVNAQSQGNITINADGSINPATAPIRQISKVYTLTSDITGCITVQANNILLDGGGHTVSGVSLQRTSNVTVKNFIAMMDKFSGIGISLNNASDSLIFNNTVTGFWSIQALNGIDFGGISIYGGTSNIINRNNLSHNLNGMEFFDTSNNVITENNVTGNSNWSPFTCLISFGAASNNTIYHNNFVNSTYQAKVLNSINTWDDSHLGNYWSDYLTKYPNASMIDNSRIGNTPYYIDAQNRDNYPLMEPFSVAPTAEASPTPSGSTTSTPESNPTPSITVLGVLAVVVIAVILTIVGLVVYYKKQRR